MAVIRCDRRRRCQLQWKKHQNTNMYSGDDFFWT